VDTTLKINVGCGLKRIPGYLGIDQYRAPSVDLLASAAQLPFCNESVDAVAAHNVLEHVIDVVETVHEFHRVLKAGGELWIRVPHGLDALYQPGHIHAFRKKSFHMFTEPATSSLESGAFFAVEREWISNRVIPFANFLKRRFPWIYWHLVDTSDYDGRERSRLPVGMRTELSVVMTKLRSSG
jgi:ubiquinone/menaquinone biosynthesis C-methylase UbiE